MIMSVTEKDSNQVMHRTDNVNELYLLYSFILLSCQNKELLDCYYSKWTNRWFQLRYANMQTKKCW